MLETSSVKKGKLVLLVLKNRTSVFAISVDCFNKKNCSSTSILPSKDNSVTSFLKSSNCKLGKKLLLDIMLFNSATRFNSITKSSVFGITEICKAFCFALSL